MEISEKVRHAMRRWPSGVAVVTSRAGERQHGMTVNSLTSVSLDPPIFSVSMVNTTRTCALTREAGILAFTFLAEGQQELSDRFAGRMSDDSDRFVGLETFSLVTGAPLLVGGLVHIDCQVIFTYPMRTSTLFLAEALAVEWQETGRPLLYFNRGYPRLGPEEE